MQEFFMDYGLWLLVGLLVIIALVFLLAGRGKADVRGEDAQVAALKASAPDAAPVPAAPARAPV